MTIDERITADFAGTGLTTGPHPMAYSRAAFQHEGYLSAIEINQTQGNRSIRIAGCVIARQRPGTAKGFVFLSLEDETGIANVIITPDRFERDRIIVTHSRFLKHQRVFAKTGWRYSCEGTTNIEPIEITSAEIRSHNFH